MVIGPWRDYNIHIMNTNLCVACWWHDNTCTVWFKCRHWVSHSFAIKKRILIWNKLQKSHSDDKQEHQIDRGKQYRSALLQDAMWVSFLKNIRRQLSSCLCFPWMTTKKSFSFSKKSIKQIQNKYHTPTLSQSLIKTLVNKRLIKNGVLKDANKEGKNHHLISAFLSFC